MVIFLENVSPNSWKAENIPVVAGLDFAQAIKAQNQK